MESVTCQELTLVPTDSVVNTSGHVVRPMPMSSRGYQEGAQYPGAVAPSAFAPVGWPSSVYGPPVQSLMPSFDIPYGGVQSNWASPALLHPGSAYGGGGVQQMLSRPLGFPYSSNVLSGPFSFPSQFSGHPSHALFEATQHPSAFAPNSYSDSSTFGTLEPALEARLSTSASAQDDSVSPGLGGQVLSNRPAALITVPSRRWS